MNEQQLRSVIRQILKENQDKSDILREYSGTEYRSLLSNLTNPFKDVAKAFMLTGQDILNSLGLVFDTLTTLNPEKIKKARAEYKKRNAEIGKKWEPIIAASKEVLSKGDFGLILFAISPAEVIGYQFGKGMVKTVKNMPSYLKEAGWEIPFLKALGIEIKSPEEKKDKKTAKKAPLKTRLNNLFFGSDKDYYGSEGHGDYGGYSESISHSENVIKEEDEKNEKLTSQNFNEQLQDYFRAVGLDVELKKLYKSLYDSKKQQVAEVMKVVEDQLQILKSFSNAKTFTDFDDIIKFAKSKEIDVSLFEKKLTDLKTDLEKQAGVLKNKLKSDKTKKMSPDQIDAAVKEETNKALSEALKGLVSSSKKTLDNSITEMRNEVEKALTADWPDDKASFKDQLSKTTQGEEYLKLIDDALNSIDQLKEAS